MSSSLKEIIKRDGRKVPFEINRLKNSIKKAMIAENSYKPDVLEKVVADVLKSIEAVFKERTPTVEEVQDIIEVALMKANLFKVAKSYIIYRNEKTKLREEKKKILNKTELDEVDKRFSVNALRLLAARYLIKDDKEMPAETPKQMFQRVALAMSLPEIFYDTRVYSKEPKFIIRKEDADIELAGYAQRLDDYDNRYSLNGYKINKWNFSRMIALYRELAQEGRMKVSFAEILKMLESGEFTRAAAVAQRAFDLMTSKDFMPNTPTLVNSGRKLGMLSACFTLDVEDDMESIMKLAHDCAMIHKSGGGTGMNFSKLRPEGDIVASTTGVASGPISFMKMIDAVSEVIKQGGVRRAANMGILEIWHPDIEKFITAKGKEGVLENFNISVGITGDFWPYLERGEDYPLRHPKTNAIVRKTDPRKLFNLIAYNAWASADPGVLFFDNINKRNIMKRLRGDVRVTNPCGEEPLYPYESCNLASINVGNYVVKNESGEYIFDWDAYHETTRFVARLLDNVISINKYPIEEIDRTTKKSRRIGVGLMGVADALFKLKIKYNSKEGFNFMKKLAEHLTYYTLDASSEIAVERGTFPIYNETDYPKGELPVEGFYHRDEWTCDWDMLVEKIKRNGLRNAMVTTAPPTGSIGMIADASTGIEPVFSLAFEKRVSVGSFYYTNEIFEEEIKKRGLYSNELVKSIVENYGSIQNLPDSVMPQDIKDVFVTAMDIHWADHIMAQAVMQMWITDSISKTINMPSNITVEDVEQAYLISHELGCKGVTIYRDESKSRQVLNLNNEKKGQRVEAKVSDYTLGVIRTLIIERPYIADYIKFAGPGVRSAEPSLNAPLKSVVESEIVQLSIAVGAEGAVTTAVEPLVNPVIGNGEIGVINPIISGNEAVVIGKEHAYAKLLVESAGNIVHNHKISQSVLICPSCDSTNVAKESGCMSCKDCGWSACTIS
ncbi:MAG: adenosylcobalamin-dependent ribonucleoside-diphosphate reductase [Candidatus Micrarchaeota archaeon]|nr:adenosylcobalamin-dependent ribonucleoside-diphosphate reductase [Candidatus Micrarchaeota archaeon]